LLTVKKGQNLGQGGAIQDNQEAAGVNTQVAGIRSFHPLVLFFFLLAFLYLLIAR
jgi:hypothetical protein